MAVCPAHPLRPTARALLLAAVLGGLLPGCQVDALRGVILPEENQVDEDGNVLTEAQVIVALATDPESDPDLRRQALMKIARSTAASEPVYLDLFRAVLADPKLDTSVAPVLMNALAEHGEPADAASMLPWLDNPEAFTRWRAAVSLQRLHHPEVIPQLVRKIDEDEDADVRMAAAAALGQYPRRDVFDALVRALDDRNFGVVHAARDALKLLTGHDAGDDPREWTRYARDRPEALLATPQSYTYQPDSASPHWLLFWSQPEVSPQTPKGYSPPKACLLYTSPSPRDQRGSRMPSSA